MGETQYSGIITDYSATKQFGWVKCPEIPDKEVLVELDAYSGEPYAMFYDKGMASFVNGQRIVFTLRPADDSPYDDPRAASWRFAK